ARRGRFSVPSSRWVTRLQGTNRSAAPPYRASLKIGGEYLRSHVTAPTAFRSRNRPRSFQTRQDESGRRLGLASGHGSSACQHFSQRLSAASCCSSFFGGLRLLSASGSCALPFSSLCLFSSSLSCRISTAG